MSKEEFLRELEEALAGDVPEAVIRDNVSYYGSYLSQEMAKGRSVEEIVSEIGEPFIIAKTIIEHCEASGACGENGGYRSYQESYQDSYQDSGRCQSSYGNSGQGNGQGRSPFSGMHYIDLNKWYWKLLAIVILFMVVSVVFRVIGGIFVLLIRFSVPLMLFFLVYWVIKNMRGR